LENGSPDNDCCAKPHEASCADGYVYHKGDGCGITGILYSTTYCLPPPPPTGPDCHNDEVCDALGLDVAGVVQIGDKCCGVEGVLGVGATVKCKNDFVPVKTGTCGVVGEGLRTKFTCAAPTLDDSKCDSGLVDKCCGIDVLTVKCKDGYEVVETGDCGVPGVEARTKYTCKAPLFFDSMCDSGLGDACCGIKGLTVKCLEGYEVVETGDCGLSLIEARTKYTCKPVCTVPTPAPAVTTYSESSTCDCSAGVKILDVDACKAAATSLGVAFKKETTWSKHASGCVKRPDGYYFNTATPGGCTAWAKAVCMS
jgi:hypothetical protein